MEILLGFALCLFLESLAYLGWRTWRGALPPVPPQPPQTAAQRANQELHEALERQTPRVVSLRLQRRTARGARRKMVEDEDTRFEA